MKKKPFLIATGFTMFYFSFNASWQVDPVKVEGGKHSYKKTYDLLRAKQYDVVLNTVNDRIGGLDAYLQTKALGWCSFGLGT